MLGASAGRSSTMRMTSVWWARPLRRRCWEAVKRIMEELKLEVNERKTRCLRCPEESLEFLGYRIGRNYRPKGEGELYRDPTQPGER